MCHRSSSPRTTHGSRQCSSGQPAPRVWYHAGSALTTSSVRVHDPRSAEVAAPTRCTSPASAFERPVVNSHQASGPRNAHPVHWARSSKRGRLRAAGPPAAPSSTRSGETAWPTRALRCRRSGSPSDRGAWRKNRWWRRSLFVVRRARSPRRTRRRGRSSHRRTRLEHRVQPGDPSGPPARIHQDLHGAAAHLGEGQRHRGEPSGAASWRGRSRRRRSRRRPPARAAGARPGPGRRRARCGRSGRSARWDGHRCRARRPRRRRPARRPTRTGRRRPADAPAALSAR